MSHLFTYWLESETTNSKTASSGIKTPDQTVMVCSLERLMEVLSRFRVKTPAMLQCESIKKNPAAIIFTRHIHPRAPSFLSLPLPQNSE
jgi:hypothetical protein